MQVSFWLRIVSELAAATGFTMADNNIRVPQKKRKYKYMYINVYYILLLIIS